MIEYKAYHKKSPGKRNRPHAARRKKRGGEETPGRTRFRRSIPIIAAVLAFLLLGAAGAAAYTWLGRSAIFSVRIVDMNPGGHGSEERSPGTLAGGAPGDLWM